MSRGQGPNGPKGRPSEGGGGAVNNAQHRLRKRRARATAVVPSACSAPGGFAATAHPCAHAQMGCRRRRQLKGLQSGDGLEHSQLSSSGAPAPVPRRTPELTTKMRISSHPPPRRGSRHPHALGGGFATVYARVSPATQSLPVAPHRLRSGRRKPILHDRARPGSAPGPRWPRGPPQPPPTAAPRPRRRSVSGGAAAAPPPAPAPSEGSSVSRRDCASSSASRLGSQYEKPCAPGSWSGFWPEDTRQ